MGNNFYDEEMYDLDPNYDESNAELDRYERDRKSTRLNSSH